MNTTARINVRVVMGAALAQFEALRSQIGLLDNAQRRMGAGAVQAGRVGGQAFSDLAAHGRRLAQTGRILLYNFTLPLVAAFAVLEKQFLKSAQASAVLRQVYTTASGESARFGQTTGVVIDELKKLDAVSFTLSNSFGVARDQVLDLMTTFGRAGQSGALLAQNTELALELFRGYQVELPKAADAILTIGTAYRLTGDQTRVALAQVAAVSQATRADVETLTAGLVKAAPPAQQLGVDIGHLTAYLGVMQQAGFKGAESGTALNFMLTRLVKVTPESSRLLKHLGIDVNEAAYAAGTATQNFDMIAKSLGKLGDRQISIALATIFGARQNPKAVALFRELLTEGGKYEELIRKMASSTDLLRQMDNDVITAMDNVNVRWGIAKTQLTNNFQVIALRLTPALLMMTGLIIQLSGWFEHLSDTAHGRLIQSIILLAVVILAAAGPIAVLGGALLSLAALAEPVAGALAAMFSPIGLAIAGAIVAVVFFRRQFVAVLLVMYGEVLAVAKAIYTALQWLNPFAHHSPSLVERTRDGVAAMIGYWKGLTPILAVMDTASAAVKNLTGAMAGFTAAQEKADLAHMRAAVVKVSGSKAGTAFDAVVASNNALMKQLPVIAAQYDVQATAVDKAKAALDAANKSVDDATASLDALQKQRDSMAATLDSLGDPEALRSQAVALQQMGRQLAEAGNTDLAAQFGAQANTLSTRSDEAASAKAKLSALDEQIKSQRDALDALTTARDALNKTYDDESAKLQLLADGYASVKAQIDANTRALTDMAAAAQEAIDKAAAAAKAAAGAKGGSGKPDPFAAFDAAGAGKFDNIGAGALPPGAPPNGPLGGNFDKTIADINARASQRLKALLPNPFAQFGKWKDEAQGYVQKFIDWFKDKKDSFHLTAPSVSGGGAGAAIGAGLDKLRSFDWRGLGQDGLGAWRSITRGWNEFYKALGGPLSSLGGSVRTSLGLLITAGEQIAEIFGKRLNPILHTFLTFWQTNGKQIGQIVGAIAFVVIELTKSFLDMANVIFKVLWPVVRFTFDNLLRVVEGAVKVISGVLTFLIQLLTGNFAEAFRGLGTALQGVWDMIIGGVKALAGLVVLALAVLAGSILNAVLGALVGLGPEVGAAGELAFEFLVRVFPRIGPKIVTAMLDVADLIVESVRGWAGPVARASRNFAEAIPGWLWDGITTAWDAVWKFGEWVGTKFAEYAPGAAKDAADFAGKIPGWLWDGVKAAWSAYWKFNEYLGSKLDEYAPGAVRALGNFGEKIPGWIFSAVKRAWGTYWKFNEYLGSKLDEYAPGAVQALGNFGEKIPGWIFSKVKSAWSAYWKFNEFLGQKLVDYAPGAARALGDFGEKIPGWIWAGVRGLWSRTVTLADWIASWLPGVARALADDLHSLGRAIVHGIANGITSIPGVLKDALMGVVKSAWDSAKSWLNVNSPSKRAMRELGAPIALGMAMGIDQHSAAVADSLVSMAQDAMSKGEAAMRKVQLSLPVLQQRVALSYEGQLSSLPSITQPVGAQAAPGAGGAGDGSTAGDTYNQTFAIDASTAEVADPLALAAVLAWRMRTQVRP